MTDGPWLSITHELIDVWRHNFVQVRYRRFIVKRTMTVRWIVV